MSEAVRAAGKRGLEQKWKVLISVMFGIFMVILDSTIVIVAFPTLRREFGAADFHRGEGIAGNGTVAAP